MPVHRSLVMERKLGDSLFREFARGLMYAWHNCKSFVYQLNASTSREITSNLTNSRRIVSSRRA